MHGSLEPLANVQLILATVDRLTARRTRPPAMTATNSAANRYRYRMRFAKRGDLRWIGHQDLLRLLERALRRAELKLGMSQGFHPKPRMSFPSALALGMEGHAEVMEFELTEPLPVTDVAARLRAEFPADLAVLSLDLLPHFSNKAVVIAASYSIAIPFDRRMEIAAAIADWTAGPIRLVAKKGSDRMVDPRRGLTKIEIRDGTLEFAQCFPEATGVSPRDVLMALGLADLESQGEILVRSRVDLAPDRDPPGGLAPTAPRNAEQKFIHHEESCSQ